MDFEAYEKECEEIRKENSAFLKLFEDDLVAAGLSKKTIRNHVSNVDFYINEYLLREDALSMEEGVSRIDSFLGYFFIHKCMWSTPGTIKRTALHIMGSWMTISKTVLRTVCHNITRVKTADNPKDMLKLLN